MLRFLMNILVNFMVERVEEGESNGWDYFYIVVYNYFEY